MLAVVCHDAGGAELISSWLSQSSEPYCLVVEGPARAIFIRKLGNIQITSLTNAIKKCDWVLCGTSWQSNLERSAIRQAKESGKKVVAYLDHWVNYRERFQEDLGFIFPNEIWVGDEDALQLAKQKISEVPIALHPNLYFKELKKELEQCQEPGAAGNGRTALYVCEPIAEHAALVYGNERYWGYTEQDAMKYFLKHLNVYSPPVTSIKVRPHPSESREKYDWVIHESPVPVVIGGDRPLVEEIKEAEMVAGCESMAMVVGLLANKEVVSVIPPGGRPCSLPHEDIIHLYEMVDCRND